MNNFLSHTAIKGPKELHSSLHFLYLAILSISSCATNIKLKMLFKSTIVALFLLAVAEARVARRQTIAGCAGSGQSCEIACASGSTGLTTCPSSFTISGGTEAGLQCIAEFNPNFNPNSVTLTEKRGLSPQDKETIAKRQATTSNDLLDGICGDNLLIFARGTTELGNMGETVGPALQDGLSAGPGSWAFRKELWGSNLFPISE